MIEDGYTRDARHAAPVLEESVEITRQGAVVVGIGDYGGTFAELPNAPHDAGAVGRILAEEYGFPLLPAGIPLLDGAAGRGAILATVEDSLGAADIGTRWLFYFAGHGFKAEDGRGYLLPADAVRDDLATYLPLPWLIDRCLDSACGEALIILDACYGGRALVRPEYLVDWQRGDGGQAIRQIVTSGNPDQPVLDGGGSGHSVFTQSLLEALQGWAGIHDEEGAIDFESLLGHLVFEVPGRLRALGLNAARQQPIGGNLVGKSRARGFLLVPAALWLPPVIVQRARGEDSNDRAEGLARLAAACQEDDHCRVLAVELAGHHLRRRGEHPDPLVAGMLRYEPVAAVRARAAEALGELGDLAGVAPLTAALDDEPEVARAAARALGRLGDAGAAPALLARLAGLEGDLFLDLVAALGAIGEREALLEALREARRRALLVPFVGPDLPRSLTGLPDRVTLARGLAGREGVAGRDSLAATAEATMGGGRLAYTYVSYMKNALDDQLSPPGPIHRALAGLDLPFWISGAYDGLLGRALGAQSITMGQDTLYERAGQPTVVRLAGDLSSVRGLVVTEDDYEQLREEEGERRLLVRYLRERLAGKLVLFLGYDPRSPDLGLLVRHVLSGHLGDVDVRAFLAWPGAKSEHAWSDWPIRVIDAEPLALVEQLSP